MIRYTILLTAGLIATIILLRFMGGLTEVPTESSVVNDVNTLG